MERDRTHRGRAGSHQRDIERGWFEESYAAIGMRKPRPIDADEARYRCGAFYRASASYHEIEDRVFDESRVVALSLAAGLGTRRLRIAEVDDVTLHRARGGGIEVKVNGDAVRADRVVVAAGCGTPLLLKDLEIDHGLKVTCTPLMVVESEHVLETSVLIDSRAGQQRFTAGFEIMRKHARGTEEVAPIIERWTQPGTHLWWALPGRATQSLATARRVYQELDLSSLGGPYPPPSPLPSFDLEDVCMYFDPSYDHAQGD